MKYGIHLSIFALLCILVIACSVNPVTGKKELSIMSEQQELAAGRNADPAIISQYGLYEDQRLQDFINKKGKEMGAISHRSNLEYNFRILNSSVVNAFAVPGGYVYFTRGIMAHFNNEAEFAGVLGHEIGHVTARHSARQQTSQLLTQVGLIGGMILSKEVRQYGNDAAQLAQLYMLSNSRKHETESDKLGVEYSTKIGYDAHYMGDFFNTLHRLSGGDKGQSIPTFLSTHPDPQDRHGHVHRLADEAQQPGQNYKVNRDAYLNLIDGLVYGEDPREGFAENGRFYHPGLKFQFLLPSQWQMLNTPAQVQMGQKDGEAAMYLGIGSGSTLQEALQKDVTDNKLQVVTSNNKNINGHSALIAQTKLTQQAQDGTTSELSVDLCYIKYGDLIYKFTGVTASQHYGKYQPVFKRTYMSFNKLTDQSKLNRQPEKIKIASVNQNGSLQSAFNRLGVPAKRHEELSVVNGMKLSDQVKAGSKLKILNTYSNK